MSIQDKITIMIWAFSATTNALAMGAKINAGEKAWGSMALLVLSMIVIGFYLFGK